MTASWQAKRGWRRSIAVRLSLALVSVFVVVLAVIGLHLYDSLGRDLAARARAELERKIDLVRRTLGEVRSVRDIPAHEGHFDEILAGQHQLVLAILDGQGTVVHQSATFGPPNPLLVARLREEIVSGREGDFEFRGQVEYLARTVKGWIGPAGAEPVWIAIAADAHDHSDILEAHGKAMITVLSLGAVVASLGGLWTIRRGLTPVRRIEEFERSISASQLDARIPLDDAPPEIGRLVEGFNAMLDRLNDSFRRMSEFSSDLAHEIRTPINSLIGHAQVALSRPRSADEYRSAIEAIAEDGERVAAIVRDMLFLARADNALAVLNKERLDLRAELENVLAYFAPLADERGVAFVREGQAEIRGDRAMVRRAISNVLSNALRHTQPGGTIQVNVGPAEAGAVCLEVSNPGPAITPEQLQRIFDRFYQANAAPAESSGGTGLGLAIVKSIVELHGGSVAAASLPEGLTTFRLKFSA